MAKPPKATPRSLKAIHDLVLREQGAGAAYSWLVDTTVRQAEQLDVQKRQITALKSRITRIQNESHRSITAPRPRSYETE